MTRKKKKRRTHKFVIWVCDKDNCGSSNTRQIKVRDVINDDICDYCTKAIHEPVTEEVNINETHD